MVTAGIDIGTKNVKVVVLRAGEIAARAMETTGFDPRAAADKALARARDVAGVAAGAVDRTCTTGVGRKEIPSDREITEVTAAARGIHYIDEAVKIVIDVGAEEARGIKVGEGGKVADFVVNEKCASGTGAFVEAMARAIEVSLDEFGEIALQSDRTVPMNAQCAVFAESEVVSLVHSDTPKKDIARAVHEAIAGRIVSMVRRIGLEGKQALVGGMAHNVGFHDSLQRGTEASVMIPDHPEYICALGAALAAVQ